MFDGAIYYDERDDLVSVLGMLKDPGDAVRSASGVLVHAVLEGGYHMQFSAHW